MRNGIKLYPPHIMLILAGNLVALAREKTGLGLGAVSQAIRQEATRG